MRFLKYHKTPAGGKGVGGEGSCCCCCCCMGEPRLSNGPEFGSVWQHPLPNFLKSRIH